MNKQTLVFAIIVIATMIFSVLFVHSNLSNNEYIDENHSDTISPTPTHSSEPKETIVDVIVQPWHGTTELDNGYGIEVESPKPNELFEDDNVRIKINVMSEEWVIQYAFFFSDLVVDKVHIPVSFSNYRTDLKKSFIIDFYYVPDGNHRVDFCVVLHDGTMGVASIDFTVKFLYDP